MKPFDKNILPQKVRLSGADCFHLVLDKHAKKHSAGGNVMRKIFYFDSLLDFESVHTILKSSPIVYWLCNIKLVPGSLLRVPYWQYEDNGREIFLQVHHCDVVEKIPEIILRKDIPVDAERFVEGDIVLYPDETSAFVLSWNHVLMDARGTTLFINHLNALNDTNVNLVDNFFPAKEGKPNVYRYIRNMYRVKSFVQGTSKRPLVSVVETKATSNADILHKNIKFSLEETEKINKNAFKNGARFGTTLFFIACCSHTINRLNNPGGKKAAIWLPVPYDGRLRGAKGPVISNKVAYLFYRILQEDLTSISKTVKSVNDQMVAQIKCKMPDNYSMFLNMMRHVPLWLYYFIISHTGRGVFASFLYTSAGENFNDLKTMFGKPLRDMFIIPSLTFPPGLTFVFLKHNDALSYSITYSPDIIKEKDLDFIEQNMRQFLLGDY